MRQKYKVIVIGMMSAALILTSTYTGAAETSASVTIDIASAYIFRGSTFNDGVVIQPGIELSGRPVTIGVWANYDIGDYDNALDDNQFSEIDIYVAYDIPITVENLGVSLGYIEYTYPGAAVETDREASVSLSLDTFLSPSLAVNYGTDGGIQGDMYVELGLGYGFEASDDLSVDLALALGYYDPDDSGSDSGLTHCNLTIGVGYKIISASLTYVNQIDDDVLVDVEDGGTYDEEVYGIIGIGFEY